MRIDAKAREAFETDPDPASLAAARIGLEHVEHHGQPLRHFMTEAKGHVYEHRFACRDGSCPFRLTWRTES